MKSLRPRWWFISGVVVLLLTIAASIAAQEDADNVLTTVEIAQGVHLLPGLSTNVLVVTGAKGALIVDSGSANSSEHVQELITKLGIGPVQIAINTHFHYDHIGSNEVLANNGAVIVAHKNGRLRMQTGWQFPEALGLGMPVVPPYPEKALPMLTFADTATLHFGEHQIDLIHFPSAHTDADLAVFLPDANILHTGDLYLSNGFPPGADAYHGGTFNGVIVALDALMDLSDDDTRIVPGHGPISNREGLSDYRKMLVRGRDRIATLVKEGKTLEEVIIADPTAGLYTSGESWLPRSMFVRLVYAELAWLQSKEENSEAALAH